MKTTTRTIRLPGRVLARLAFSLAGAMALLSAPQDRCARAALPQEVAFQGRLTDLSGVPLNGTFNIVFRIFDLPAGGTELWTETHTGVSVSSGAVSRRLGASTPIPFSVADSTSAWLEIQVGAELLTPRQPFLSSLYAFRAREAEALAIPGGLGGIAISTSLFVTPGSVGIGTLSVGPASLSNGLFSRGLLIESGTDNPGIILRHSGAPGSRYFLHSHADGSFAILNDLTAAEPFYISPLNRVGIGLSNPATELHVQGRIHVTSTAAQVAIVNTAATVGDAGSARLVLLPQGGGLSTQQDIYGVDGALSLRTGGVPGAVNSTERIRISSTGLTGIGTSLPAAGTKLDVVGGNIRTDSGIIAATGTFSASLLVAGSPVLTAAAGAASLASPNTFLSSQTFQHPQFSIGGSTFVVAGGRVGIRTAPTADLTVAGGAGVGAGEQAVADLREAGSGTALLLGYRANGASVIAGRVRAGTGLDLELGSGGTPNAVSINNAGRVGIGTPTPLSRLDVLDNDLGAVQLIRVGTGAVPAMLVLEADADLAVGHALPQARLHVSSAGAAAAELVLLVSSGAGPGLFSVRGDGKVGLGTTSPVGTLQINEVSPVITLRDVDSAGSAAVGILNFVDQFGTTIVNFDHQGGAARIVSQVAGTPLQLIFNGGSGAQTRVTMSGGGNWDQASIEPAGPIFAARHSVGGYGLAVSTDARVSVGRSGPITLNGQPAALSIENDLAFIVLRDTGAANSAAVAFDAAGRVWSAGATDNGHFDVSDAGLGVTRLRVQGNGRTTIGLGTSASGAQLQVSSANATGADVVLRVSSGAAAGQDLLDVRGDGVVVAHRLTVKTGVSGPGLQHVRQTTGSVANGATTGITVAWPVPFADASYSAVCIVQEGTIGTQTLTVRKIQSQNNADVNVMVSNTDVTPRTGTLHCIGMHD